MEPATKRKPAEDQFVPDKNPKYRQDVLLLKGRAMNFFDRLMTFDLNFEEDRQQAKKVTQRLIRRLEGLGSEHLDGPGHKEPRKQLRLEDLSLAVEKVRDCKEKNLIGAAWTHIALKNHDTILL